MPTNYQRGRQFEYRTRNKLIDMGAVYVMRAAQSKGKVDLLALWPEAAMYEPQVPWIVQCKRDGRLPKAEREALLELHHQCHAIPILAKTGPNGRGVEFIDLRDGRKS